MGRWAAVGMLAAASLVVPAAAAAHAAQTRLVPRADTYVDAASAHRAYGDRWVLRVSSFPPRRAYLRFRVPHLRSEIARADLRLSIVGGAGRLRVQRAAATWSERWTTWARAPGVRGRAITSRALRRGRVTIDVRSLVGAGRAVNLVLSGGRDVRIWSRESARPPILVIQTTPPPSGPVVAAAGDIACSPADPDFNGGLGTAIRCAQSRTSSLLLGGNLAAVLALGDEQYNDATLTEFRAAFDPTWGRVKALIHPVPGNHEYLTSGAQGYFDYFDGVGATSGPAGPRGQGYYSFDVGTWHLIALNSNCAFVAGGGCAPGSAQERWLAADLQAHPAACTLAYWHHPRWTSGDIGDDTQTSALWNDLYAAGAELVITGHAHDYERFAPQGPTTTRQRAGTGDPAHGIREFVVGSGGEDHQAMSATRPNREVRDNTTFGVLELTLRPRSYGWRFVPEAGGTFTDSGETPCH